VLKMLPALANEHCQITHLALDVGQGRTYRHPAEQPCGPWNASIGSRVEQRLRVWERLAAQLQLWVIYIEARTAHEQAIFALVIHLSIQLIKLKREPTTVTKTKRPRRPRR
jgi:hypothetical protein